MRHLTSIVAMNEEGAIGRGNTLPWRVRSDLKFFRDQTEGNVVIMGRRTYDSLGKSLPNRKNIVVTHGFHLFSSTQNCKAAHSIDEALIMAEDIRSKREDVFVIGGASMYEQFSPYVSRYLITEVRKDVPDADTFLSPDLIGDVDDWHAKTLFSGKANDYDEADFTIFELTLRDPTAVERRRERIYSKFASARRGTYRDERAFLRAAG